MDKVNAVIEQLIDAGHGEAATIAEWKDGLNEMWADLLELIDTRMQLLAASYELHYYFYTGTEILGLIDEKHRELPEDVGLDASTAESFHRVHTAFQRELHQLGVQVPLSLLSTHRLQGPAFPIVLMTSFPGAPKCPVLSWLLQGKPFEQAPGDSTSSEAAAQDRKAGSSGFSFSFFKPKPMPNKCAFPACALF